MCAETIIGNNKFIIRYDSPIVPIIAIVVCVTRPRVCAFY